MKIVYVLGNGQLGKMLRQAGEPLGIKVNLLDPISYDNKNLLPCDVITNEIESWPVNPLTHKIMQSSSFINKEILLLITDRVNQKKLLNKLNIKTSPWKLLSHKNEWKKIFQNFGEPVIVKQRNGGYDGTGQWNIYSDSVNNLPTLCYNKCIIEKYIDYSYEISLIGARSLNGQLVFYPITKTFHQHGILKSTVSFSKKNINYQQNQAECMLSTIMNELNYVGVMAMECFVTNDGSLLVNELAPRVHNSGHWTQNGASINQFELHLRAILNLPVPNPIILNNYSIMINLLGIQINYAWLKHPLIHLHWYAKEIRFRRKVGHLNLSTNNLMLLKTTLKKMILLLPIEYERIILWIIKQLH